MDYIYFLLNNKRLISFGFILTFFSSFGQTFLLSLYVPKLIIEYNLSNSFFGGLYAFATVGSSFVLVFVGKLIDKSDLRTYSLYSSFLLLSSCLILAFSFNIVMIFIGLFGLRFAGQGLLSHISNTSISKSFDKTRGKALSITSLGYSFGEGLLPLLMSVLIFNSGWRNSLIFSSMAVAFILIPFIWTALKNYNNKTQNQDYYEIQFDRKKLIKDKKFYILAANSMVLPFLITGLFFYQSELALYKNWTLEWLSFAFIGFALGRTVFSLLIGKIIDNYSATRLLSFFLIPFLLGLILLFIFENPYTALAYLVLTGISVGAGGNIKTAAIAEIYGTKNLGAVRSLFTTIMILGTALSPLLFGIILDNGFGFSSILICGIFLTTIVAIQSAQLSKKYNTILASN